MPDIASAAAAFALGLLLLAAAIGASLARDPARRAAAGLCAALAGAAALALAGAKEAAAAGALLGAAAYAAALLSAARLRARHGPVTMRQLTRMGSDA